MCSWYNNLKLKGVLIMKLKEVDLHIDNLVEDWLKPVFILDIDGVINPFYARLSKESSHDCIPEFEEYPILNSSMKDVSTSTVFLNKVQLNKYFDLLEILAVPVWGSAWNENANLIHSTIHRSGSNWPNINFDPISPFGFNVKTWKLPTVKEYVEENFRNERPIIWIDDELEEDAFEWVANRPGGGLAIKTKNNLGLTEAQWREIYNYALSLKPEF